MGFDESGNTGQNLLDEHQPVFVLGSAFLSDEQFNDLRATLDVDASEEIHFVQLKRNPRNWDRIVEAAGLPWIADDVAKMVVYHKRFMIVTKIVDMLIEEILHQRGVDLYVQGRNIAMANAWFHAIPAFRSPKGFNALLDAFVTMVRDPTGHTIDDFYGRVWEVRRESSDREFVRESLGLLLETLELAPRIFSKRDSVAADPAVPAFLQCASRWDEQLDRPFAILHDASKPVEHAREILECFMSKDEPTVISGYDRRKTRFPLRVEQIRFVDSASEPVVQAADFFAGCVAHAVRGVASPELSDDLSEAILRTALFALDHNAIWPSTDVTPEELGTEEIGGINPADYAGELIARQLAKRRAEEDMTE